MRRSLPTLADPDQISERGIPARSLDSAEVGPVHARLFGQTLLRPPLRSSQPAYAGSQVSNDPILGGQTSSWFRVDYWSTEYK